MQQHVYSIAQVCELANIQHAVICPGSRSAPLVFAFSQSSIRCHSIVDERSAAYTALGMAQQTGKPVVLICTSGTAALNFFPAVAEAFYQQIPLVVLTADRPPELLNQQDGQMIMQQNMYGSHVKASYNIPCYAQGKENFSETTGIVNNAIGSCLNGAPGPVHINIPLAEPLYPHKKNAAVSQNLIAAKAPNINTKPANFAALQTIIPYWKQAKRKLVIIGQMQCNASLTGALVELQKQPDVVIICDILSNQYQYNTAPQFDYLLMRGDTQIFNELNPDCIISVGGPVLSKTLKKWLQGNKPASHFRFNSGNINIDTYNNVTHHLKGDISHVLFELGRERYQKPTRYKQFWQTANSVIANALKTYSKENTWSELHAMFTILNQLPDAANIQVGNSSVIRYISYLGKTNPSWVLNGNRGTSGIDGCTSTAVGAALVNNRPTFLLTGDIAFLYDINALWNRLPNNLKIIIFNNNGGGIFQLIDGPGKHKKQLEYFTTPHNQNIEKLTNGIPYIKATSLAQLKDVGKKFFDEKSGSGILELTFNLNQNSEEFKRFKKLPL